MNVEREKHKELASDSDVGADPTCVVVSGA